MATLKAIGPITLQPGEVAACRPVREGWEMTDNELFIIRWDHQVGDRLNDTRDGLRRETQAEYEDRMANDPPPL